VRRNRIFWHTLLVAEQGVAETAITRFQWRIGGLLMIVAQLQPWRCQAVSEPGIAPWLLKNIPPTNSWTRLSSARSS
jgi:hypothetical protein